RAVLRQRPAGRVQCAGKSRQAGHRGRPGSGLSGPSLRADAAAAGDSRVHHQDAGDLRRVRRAGQPHAAARREQRRRAGRRGRVVRSALPPLFRSEPRRGRRGRAGLRRLLKLQPFLTGVLLLLGVGFLVANARLVLEYLRFRRRRRGALLVWPSRTPANDGVALAIGVMLGFLVFYKLIRLRQYPFGEIMMFVYYAYLMPLSRRIG